MATRKVLFIGLVWPEPTSSAAGTRIVQLVQLFLANGDEVHFASAASKSEFSFDLENLGIINHDIKLNDSSFDTWLAALNPNLVAFDRFMIEEQYGWRVQEKCPNALRILDTEDLHFLRQARQTALKNKKSLAQIDLYNDVTKRELAAILRCDLSLIISQAEMEVLETFKINSQILYYLPFLEEEITAISNWNTFEERKDLVFIGNYLHDPNWQTLQYLKTMVWPLLRKKLPEASLHIYGAYASEKVTQLHNPREKFLVHGRAENARTTIVQHRILLAPLLFGAGAKGKFVDAMQTGTPIATSSVGAEGMANGLDWAGIISDNLEQLVDETAALYNDQILWEKAQQNGIQIINQLYAKSKFEVPFLKQIAHLEGNLTAHRQQNFLGEVLKHHTLQSTKYMSLWIEEKNK
ncbi:glycosyltransferase [Pedobacter chitinilyticus]|uniref:Glycosyltransferase n=1 Tax=Pedobacter chitinilyticus TaxID=2233776 RepID=A0A443YMF5_9SPHI|nr:glycosyltransferase [Pedobacter chitinilyticus]RWU04930.1 glycosyltransferase [Pedobacter chitinilyticus]